MSEYSLLTIANNVASWEETLPNSCPRCHAKPQERCTSLVEGPKRYSVLKWPHQERNRNDPRRPTDIVF